jgi:hypothetical protein
MDTTPEERERKPLIEIPEAMWARIAEVQMLARLDTAYSSRTALVKIGEHYGFNEEELITKGIVAEEKPAEPKPWNLKGGRR